jgi:hypothetical protein
MAVLVSNELTVVTAFSAATAVVVAIAALLVALVVEAARGGDDVAGDIQRFIELSEAAHGSLPDGPLLSDPHGETSAAIDRLLANREQARRALWGSRHADLLRPRASREEERSEP